MRVLAAIAVLVAFVGANVVLATRGVDSNALAADPATASPGDIITIEVLERVEFGGTITFVFEPLVGLGWRPTHFLGASDRQNPPTVAPWSAPVGRFDVGRVYPQGGSHVVQIPDDARSGLVRICLGQDRVTCVPVNIGTTG